MMNIFSPIFCHHTLVEYRALDMSFKNKG